MNREKRTRLLVGLTVFIAAIGWWLANCSPRSKQVERAQEAPPPAQAVRHPPHQAAKVRPVVPKPDDAPAKIIIDEIVVEKTEVCEGEENLVTVRAHTEGNRDDEHLHYLVNGTTGDSVPVRLAMHDPEAAPPDRKIIVFGRDNTSVTVDFPKYRVKECEPDRRLLMKHRLLPNSWSELEFHARIDTLMAAKPLAKPIRYEWTFGDGANEVTSVPVVVHDFGDRPQDTYYSQFLVSCRAVGANGEVVLGRHSLQLMNPAYEALYYKGVVQIFTVLNPRFPVQRDDGVVTQWVHLYHLRPDPVRITRITAERSSQTGAIKREEVPVQTLLGATSIPVAGHNFIARLDTRAESDVFTINYYLEGVSAEGYRVGGSFSVMRPPEQPNRKNSTAISDAYLKAKIMRARKILGRDIVYDEDLIRLEKEGQFDDIRPEDFPPPPPGPEPPVGSPARPK